YTSKYIDVENTPLYPFGYGLSYTDFKYSEPRLSAREIAIGDSLQVTVDVQNTGERTGEEVVQLYIRDLVASVTRPVKELRAFEKIELRPGQRKTASFTLTAEDFSFYNQELERVIEPGLFKLFTGTNSRDVKTSEVVIR